MGYTHYWRHKEISNEDWDGLVEEVYRVCTAAWADGLAVRLRMEDSYMAIDGPEGESCETFYIAKNNPDNFDFCKTRQYPYDKVVVAILHYMSEHDLAAVSSDGGGSAIRKIY